VVTSQRERALNDLRAYSAPGTRARLLQAAWDAGETRIAVLAEAAGITRQTVYTDLASRGIDPRTDRPEENTGMYHTITINGLTGSDTETTNEAIAAAYRQHTTQPAGSDVTRCSRWAAGYVKAWDAAKAHNRMVPAANAVAEARQDAQRALRVVETRWEALRTARAWEAAHHAYVEAVHDARRRISTWQHATDEAARQVRELTTNLSELDRVYATHVPADDRIDLDWDAPKLALTELEETHRQRRAIAAETLSALHGDSPKD
jgi:hypothetical protein